MLFLYIYFLNHELQVGKTAIGSRVINSLFRDGIEANQMLNLIIKQLLAIGGRERKVMGKIIFVSRTEVWSKPKDLNQPGLTPQKFGNLVPRLISETRYLEHQA